MEKNVMVKEIKRFLVENMNGKLEAGIVALRYDNKNIEVGEILGNSIANWEREDSRDFPEYNCDCEKINGTSVYSLTSDLWYMDTEEEVDEVIDGADKIIVGSEITEFKHCSIVIGNDEVNTIDAEDDGEAIVTNCKVVKVLF